MAVRNFWVDAYIDGRETMVCGGPRAKDGGMTVKIRQRGDGKSFTAMTVRCYEENGYLFTEVYDVNDRLVGTVQSAR